MGGGGYVRILVPMHFYSLLVVFFTKLRQKATRVNIEMFYVFWASDTLVENEIHRKRT